MRSGGPTRGARGRGVPSTGLLRSSLGGPCPFCPTPIVHPSQTEGLGKGPNTILIHTPGTHPDNKDKKGLPLFGR